MRLLQIFTITSLAIMLFIGCSKKSDNSKTGTFSFTKVNGKTYTATYVDAAIPSKNGTFSLQYQTNSTSTRWMFFVYVDNNNDLGLDVIGQPIVNGVSYTSNSSFGRTVSFYGKLDNESLNPSRTTVVFEKSTYPGQIVGSFTVYGSNNTIIGSGNFDFEAK